LSQENTQLGVTAIARTQIGSSRLGHLGNDRTKTDCYWMRLTALLGNHLQSDCGFIAIAGMATKSGRPDGAVVVLACPTGSHSLSMALSGTCRRIEETD